KRERQSIGNDYETVHRGSGKKVGSFVRASTNSISRPSAIVQNRLRAGRLQSADKAGLSSALNDTINASRVASGCIKPQRRSSFLNASFRAGLCSRDNCRRRRETARRFS